MSEQAQRVAARYITARTFSSPEALQKYLKDHPKADKNKHKVKKSEPGGAPKKRAPNPHKLRDRAQEHEAAGDHAAAFEHYSAAAEGFRQKGLHDAAKSMDAAARGQAKKWKAKQPKPKKSKKSK